MTFVLVGSSSPFLATTSFSHGHDHYISTELINGTLKVVFHHDSEDEARQHDSHSKDHYSRDKSSNHNTVDHRAGAVDHVLTISTTEGSVSLESSNGAKAYEAIKLLPIIIVQSIFTVLNHTIAESNIPKPVSHRKDAPASCTGLQTTVLLI